MAPTAAFPAADSVTVLHLLGRLTFGPRPGDIARVQARGIARWLEEQLDPERIADPIQEAVRERHAVAFLPPAELFRRYPPPQVQRRMETRADGRMEPAGNDPPDSVMRQQQGRLYRELGGQVIMATLERHVASERQLQEVMADFWFNHFNVFIGKNQARYLTSDYVERAIRPNALGRFEDLLVATARHPAMLVYLDNAQSIAPLSRPPGRLAPRLQERMPTGINENYARELLELHTLGVDGGYTQADVQNVARILTGWSATGPGPLAGGPGRRFGGSEPFSFEFRAWAHDRGEKTVLGVAFQGGRGEEEGRELLRMLAEHPATAHHIATKLCRRFVSDAAPDGCVDAAAAAFRRTHGDIRAVLRAVVGSDDFWAPVHRGAKTKTPLEFVVSALRASGARADGPMLAMVLQQLGQPLFGQSVPTGWPETSEDWVNGGALLARMNVAMAIAAGRLPGATVNLDAVVPLTGDRDSLVARVNQAVLGGQGSAHTLGVIRRQIGDIESASQARVMAVGLALGSPDFQRQ